VPVGPLVQDSTTEGEDTEIMEWLGRKRECLTVFISFGSECFLTKEEMKEIALRLELSSVNFIWVLGYPQSETIDVVEALPDDFVERLKGRGRIVEGWVPQAKILGHSSVGGFVIHCGWNSLLESVVFCVLAIPMPRIHDQPLNARLAVEIGAAVEVMRDENGRLKRVEIAKVIKDVLIGNIGQAVWRKMKDLSDKMKLKEKEDLDGAVAVLAQLCEKSSHQGKSALWI
jgi:UDP:flavonoid glycosyltransferase YjiC (YdhE family)